MSPEGRLRVASVHARDLRDGGFRVHRDDAIRFEGVSVTRAGRRLLKDVSLSVPRGSRLVMIGKNGAGKTTLFNLLSGSDRPSDGDAFILGSQLGKCDMRMLRTRIGIGGSATLERLSPAMTLREAVLGGSGQILSQWWLHPSDADVERADLLLERIGMADKADRSLSTLSMGERQQVGIARAMIGEPEILLLDEPTAGLDLGAREEFIRRMSALCLEHPLMTIALVTHHVEEIPPSFDTVLGLKDGSMVMLGTLAQELTSKNLSMLFDADVVLSRVGNRFVAFANQ